MSKSDKLDLSKVDPQALTNAVRGHFEQTKSNFQAFLNQNKASLPDVMLQSEGVQRFMETGELPGSTPAGKDTRPIDQVLKELWVSILQSKSMTVIDYLIEGAQARPDFPADQKTALATVMATNKLDLVWAYAHEQRGEDAQAKTLRDFVARKSNRA